MLGIVILLYTVFSTSREPPQPRITDDCRSERVWLGAVVTTARVSRSNARKIENFDVIVLDGMASVRADGSAPARSYAISKD